MKPRMIVTCAQTSTRSITSVPSPPPNRLETAFETGDHSAGYSFRPSAMREACQPISVTTMPAIASRIRSASRRWLPSNRRGRWILRIAKAAITPISTIVANTSTISANQPCSPSHGMVEVFETTPISAMMIVGKSTTKPQKMNACMRPGTRRWNSLRWPATITTSFLTRVGTSSNRASGLPSRMIRYSCRARRPNRPPATAIATASTMPAITSASPPPRISAAIAGTTSCRSPITA